MYLIRMKGEDIMNFWFLLICFGVAFLAQYALGMMQMKSFTINFGKLRRQGKVAIGKKKGAFRAGSIVIFAVDENGIILDSSYMSGVTVLAKFKKLKGFEGLNVSTLKKEDTKGFPKQVQDAMERELASITLEDVKKDTEKYIVK